MGIVFKVVSKLKDEELTAVTQTLTIGFPDENGTLVTTTATDSDFALFSEGASYSLAAVPFVAQTDPAASKPAPGSAAAADASLPVPASHPAVIQPADAADAAAATTTQVAVASTPQPSVPAVTPAAVPVVVAASGTAPTATTNVASGS